MKHQQFDTCIIRLAAIAPFRIGEIEVEPATRRIWRGNQEEILEPRVMQVLVALAEAEGGVVSRDELVVRCWDGRIVGDNAIHRVVSRLRHLQNGFGAGCFHVETIAKVGYRLIASPVALDCVEPPTVSADPIAFPDFSIASRRTLVGGIAAGLVATGGVGYLLLAPRPDTGEASVESLIAQSELALRNASPDGARQAVGFLEAAVKRDPASAPAWGRLATARMHVAQDAPSNVMETAIWATQDAARRALAIDQRQPDALSALALLPPYFGDWATAERGMKAVLAIDPGHVPTRAAYAFFLVAVGRAREGAAGHIQVAAREPLNPTLQFHTVYANWILGDIGAADRAADRAVQLWPKHPGVWYSRLWTFAFTGRANRAIAHLRDTGIRPDFPASTTEMLDTALRALDTGSRGDTEAAIRAIIDQVSVTPNASVAGVMLLIALAEIDRAFDVAQAFLAQRGPLIASVRWRPGTPTVNDERHRKTNMLFVPVAAPMRTDPRFLPLMKDIGLADYWRASRVNPDFMQR